MIQAIIDSSIHLGTFNVWNKLLQLCWEACRVNISWLCEADWSSCLREFRVVILYYFCGTLDDLVSGQNPHSIQLLESLSCLCCWRRVEPSTRLLQNFSAVSVDLCTVVRKQWLVCIILRSEGYQLQWAGIPPGQGERQHEVCTTNLTLFPCWSTRKGYPVKAYPSTSDTMFYPCVYVCVNRYTNA